MVCNQCNIQMIEGNLSTVNSSFPIGIAVNDRHMGALICFACPNCGDVVIKLSPKAKEKINKAASNRQ